MTVLCANCHTANRDRAMFCIGCTAKLPAFAATGPSALQALGGASARPKARAASDTGRAPLNDATVPATATPPRGLLIAVLLLGATVLALAAWIGFGPPRATAPGMASAAAPLTPLPATAVATPAPAPASQVPVEAALATGESTVPATTPAPAPPTVIASAPAQVASVEAPEFMPTAPVQRGEPPQRTPQRSASVGQASASRGAADPRAGCEHLFFVLAARCEARHCDEAAYTRHPRCTIVRAQRQRDEARRNLTQ